MSAFFKIVGGITVCVIVGSVLFGILHLLLSLAVAGIVLVIFGVFCLLAVVGLIAVARGLLGQSRPSFKGPRRTALPLKRAHKKAEQTLREWERKQGPRQ